jgi:dihydrofolate reductase
MRELAILTFVTLDGVMQAPGNASEDRSGNFQHAGWARPYWDDVMAQVGRTAMAETYDLLLGRRTYEIFQGAFASDDAKSPLLQVHGSWQLIQLLLAHDLVDEYRLWVFPITLGSGKRLFAENAPQKRLSLAKTEPTGNGVVMTVYRR